MIITTYSANHAPDAVAAPMQETKVWKMLSGAFRGFCSLITTASGAGSLAASHKPVIISSQTNATTQKTQNTVAVFFIKVKKCLLETNYNAIYGSLYVVSGLCAVTSSLHDLGAYNLGKTAYGILDGIELGTFLAASLMALYTSVARYQEADASLPVNPTAAQAESVKRKKASAILGIASSVAYIINIALLLIGQMAALAFVIGLLGTLISFVKVLYDFFQPAVAIAK